MNAINDEESYDLSEFDPDIVLITDYLANELSDEAREAFYKRMAEDPEFYEKAFSLIEIWDHPVKLAEIPARVAEWEAKKQEVVEQPKVIELVPKRRRYTAAWGWGSLVLAAAAVVGVVVVRQMSRSAPEAPTVPVRVAMTPHDSVLAMLEASGALAKLPGPQLIATGPTETRVVVLADSSVVRLQPNSWIAYSDSLDAMVGGEAEVDLKRGVGGRGRTMTVLTATGKATLSAGRYALQAAPKNGELVVRVLRGTAKLAGLGGLVQLRPGQYGRIPMNGVPVRTVPLKGEKP